MRLTILLSCLHIAAVLAKGDISCEIPAVESMAPTSLTCIFPEDVRLKRTDFSVHHANRTEKPVLDCLWVQDNLECFNTAGYEFNRTVTNKLTIWIHRAYPNMTGEYYCKLADSTAFNIQHCQLVLTDETHRNVDEQESKALIIGLSMGLSTLFAITLLLVFLLLKRRRVSKNPPTSLEEEQSKPLVTINKGSDRLLQERTIQMYPKMHETFYFIPPIYFNKTLYKKETVAGEEVYIPQKSSPGDISHDRAMQHVLNCLRQIAEQGQEQMFVLTQFQYRDYLPNLPEDAKCFDFLIVHRKHGVVIGVVKAVGDKEDKTKKDEQTTDKSILTQIAEAVQQLNYADQMIRSISPDLSKVSKICKTVMLPKLTISSLKRAVNTDHDLTSKLRRCFGPEALSDPTEMCLCSEHLADENKTLDDKAVSNIRQIWKWTTSNTDGVDMSKELYLGIVARLCGPSTQSSLQVPEGYEGFKLPKTLADAVSLTGDLYQRSMLGQDMIELLNHRTVFLAGTPNTGKTRMLTLVGRKCLIDGYTIFIIKDSSSKNDAFLSQYLKKQSTEDRIVDEECDFKSQNQRQKCIERIIKEKGDKTCILVDVAHLKGKHVDQFCENLQKNIKPDLFLWVSCNEGTCPPLGEGRRVKKILNCPPAVMREVAKAKVYSTTDVDADDKSEYLLPTDGPPVVHVPHTVSCKSLVHNCEKCGQAVGEFLSENLLNCRKDESTSGTDDFSPLRFEDCLILFEKDFNITKENNFLKGLMTFNIKVDVVKKEESTVVANDDSVLAMSVSQMQTSRMKRKIVIYVESYVRDAKDKENKQRALTSCTSQLILVQPIIENNSFFTRIKSAF